MHIPYPKIKRLTINFAMQNAHTKWFIEIMYKQILSNSYHVTLSFNIWVPSSVCVATGNTNQCCNVKFSTVS